MLKPSKYISDCKQAFTSNAFLSHKITFYKVILCALKLLSWISCSIQIAIVYDLFSLLSHNTLHIYLIIVSAHVS